MTFTLSFADVTPLAEMIPPRRYVNCGQCHESGEWGRFTPGGNWWLQNIIGTKNEDSFEYGLWRGIDGQQLS